MGKVERADRPGNFNKCDFLGPGQQHRDVADGIVVEVNPEVGRSRASVLIMVVYELFPSLGVVFILYRTQGSRIICPRSRKSEPVNRQPAHAGDYPAEVLV